jgi:hypothetical protein
MKLNTNIQIAENMDKAGFVEISGFFSVPSVANGFER